MKAVKAGAGADAFLSMGLALKKVGFMNGCQGHEEQREPKQGGGMGEEGATHRAHRGKQDETRFTLLTCEDMYLMLTSNKGFRLYNAPVKFSRLCDKMAKSNLTKGLFVLTH